MQFFLYLCTIIWGISPYGGGILQIIIEMKLVKRLDTFVLGNFIPLFAATFCISLFAFMMQFLWKYVDDLVGKGLELSVLAQFFFYATETLVPLSLPLAVLLASLISFGNMGERLELLAIKAAGITLWRTMQPVLVAMVLTAGVSFYFQNVIGPQAQMGLYRLMYSIEEKSPELEIPEGVFYNGIQGFNVYVKKKNKETGMMYSTMIYKIDEGISRASILLADSASLETSADKRYLLLHLYNGEEFENMQNSSAFDTQNVPYRRESFIDKLFLIDFDSNFEIAGTEGFTAKARTKNMAKLVEGVDSISALCDSMGRAHWNSMLIRTLEIPNVKDDTRSLGNKKYVVKDVVEVDSLYDHLSAQEKSSALMNALRRVQIEEQDAEFDFLVMDESDGELRRHWIQYWQMLTLSLSCILFFLVGAPLGAIIRKGGLGMPMVVAVVVFILYYIIDTGSMKLGREGTIPVWIGMWMSSVILAPLGIILTVKANNDSVVFNADAYTAFFRRLFGIPQKRHIVRKEVIIHDPDYSDMREKLTDVAHEARQYRKTHKRLWQIQLIPLILRRERDEDVERLCDKLEYCIEELSNSRDRQVLLLLNNFPVPLRSARFRNRLRREFKGIAKNCDRIVKRIGELQETNLLRS